MSLHTGGRMPVSSLTLAPCPFFLCCDSAEVRSAAPRQETALDGQDRRYRHQDDPNNFAPPPPSVQQEHPPAEDAGQTADYADYEGDQGGYDKGYDGQYDDAAGEEYGGYEEADGHGVPPPQSPVPAPAPRHPVSPVGRSPKLPPLQHRPGMPLTEHEPEQDMGNHEGPSEPTNKEEFEALWQQLPRAGEFCCFVSFCPDEEQLALHLENEQFTPVVVGHTADGATKAFFTDSAVPSPDDPLQEAQVFLGRIEFQQVWVRGDPANRMEAEFKCTNHAAVGGFVARLNLQALTTVISSAVGVDVVARDASGTSAV